ncbi:MAG: zinc-ribbon domain-containing protein [Eubacteriales bacterium]
MPYCNNCGTALSESTNFCTVCGNKIIQQANPGSVVQIRTETIIPQISNKLVWLAIFSH